MRHIIVGFTLFGFLMLATVSPASAQKKKKEDITPAPRKEDIPKYINMLKTAKDAADRAQAADQIGRRGQILATDVKEAIEPLQNALKKDSDARVRKAAAEALGNIAPEPEKTVPILIDALKDKALEVNLAAVFALGQYGVEARSALPALREFANKKDDKKIKLIVFAAIKEITGAKKKG